MSDKIKTKISSLKEHRKNKDKFEPNKQVLKTAQCLSALEDLHSRFVVVPIDKASSNIAFVCKRFYAQVLISELGLGKAKSCSTYESIHCDVNELIEKDSKKLSETFNLPIAEDSRKLPHNILDPKTTQKSH